MARTTKLIISAAVATGVATYVALRTDAPEPTLFVNRLVWSQPDACAGWEVVAATNGVVVTNIPRPIYGDTFTNTIVSPFGGLHIVRSYTR